MCASGNGDWRQQNPVAISPRQLVIVGAEARLLAMRVMRKPDPFNLRETNKAM
jgi:hypothetical protein